MEEKSASLSLLPAYTYLSLIANFLIHYIRPHGQLGSRRNFVNRVQQVPLLEYQHSNPTLVPHPSVSPPHASHPSYLSARNHTSGRSLLPLLACHQFSRDWSH